MNSDQKREILAHGIACFNRGLFFECHEALEQIWLAETPEEKPFYQGLIQVAAAFHHFQSGKLAGARSLLRQGLEKLAAYPSEHHGIDLSGLRAVLQPWLRVLDSNQESAELTLPRIRHSP